MHGDVQPRSRSFALPCVLLLLPALFGCSHSPLAQRSAAFASAAMVTASGTGDAYTLVERSFRDAQTARMVAHFDDSGFDPSQIKPFLPEADRKIRSDLVEGLRSYAELLTAVSGNGQPPEADTGAKAMAAILQDVNAQDLAKAHLDATDTNVAATAIGILGRELLDRKRRRELPSILHEMQQPIETICNLLAQDIGDPARSGLRNELHINYLDLLRNQKNYIVDNAGKLSPSEKRSEIRVLPNLVSAEADSDQALAETQKALIELARTHTALAASARQKDAPAFRLQLQQLDATARSLTASYQSLSSHP